ncbi:hypothetical protein N4G70_28550 [Streptomyces sp. ASQP_92]|nr:hypothetical protein [Streptomyces sp. ASQP_92]MCT9092790.1 hypothetical protein [Streptomyces sp. ASQP_92]
MERDVMVTDRFEREMQRRREQSPRGLTLFWLRARRQRKERTR